MPAMERRTCPVRDCKSKVAGKVMCLHHWRLVPFTAQFEVYREWANAKSARNNLTRISSMRRYLDARNKSIELATKAAR